MTLSPIHLDLGEPGHTPPPEATSAATMALDSGLGYAPPQGFRGLREALAEKVSRKNAFQVDPRQVVITTGASMALTAVLAAIKGQVDRVLVPDPGYPSYRHVARTLNVPVCSYQATTQKTMVSDIENILLDGRSTAVVTCSPQNPTGEVVTCQTTRCLVQLLEKRNVVLISDEVYEDFVYEGSHVSPASLSTTLPVYTIFSFSKSFAMTGWRVGYVVTPNDVAVEVQRQHWHLAMSASSVSQAAALGACRSRVSYIQQVRSRYRKQRDDAVSFLRQNGFPVDCPDGGFFLWIPVEPPWTGTEFSRQAWKRFRVSVQPGRNFGRNAENRIRLNFTGDPCKLLEGVERLANLYEIGSEVPRHA